MIELNSKLDLTNNSNLNSPPLKFTNNIDASAIKKIMLIAQFIFYSIVTVVTLYRFSYTKNRAKEIFEQLSLNQSSFIAPEPLSQGMGDALKVEDRSTLITPQEFILKQINRLQSEGNAAFVVARLSSESDKTIFKEELSDAFKKNKKLTFIIFFLQDQCNLITVYKASQSIPSFFYTPSNFIQKNQGELKEFWNAKGFIEDTVLSIFQATYQDFFDYDENVKIQSSESCFIVLKYIKDLIIYFKDDKNILNLDQGYSNSIMRHFGRTFKDTIKSQSIIQIVYDVYRSAIGCDE